MNEERERKIYSATQQFVGEYLDGLYDAETLARKCANWADEHPKNPWIKLSEEKPQPKMRVIFLDKAGKAHFGSGNITNDGAVVVCADGENVPILTHWMPIPELPKGE